MYIFQKSIFGAFFLLPFLTFAQYTDVINSNRPGESMSAYSVGKTVIQAEVGVYGIKEKHSLLDYKANGLGSDLTLRWGMFLEKLELIADIQYQNENVTAPNDDYSKVGFKQTILGAKYLIYDPFKNYEKKINMYSWKANNRFDWHQLIPAISVFAGANFTSKDNPYAFSPESSISPKIILVTQNHFGDGNWVFVTNIIGDFILTDYPSYGYILTLTRGFNKKWSGFIENQGYKSDFYSDAIIRGGAAYLLNKSMQIDASISTSLKDTPSILYGGIGFSWRYDKKYKSVKLKTKKSDPNEREDSLEEESKRKLRYEK